MNEKKSTEYVLVPVDFSPHSEAAILLASKLARCFDASPLVLHVVHDPGEMPGYYAPALKKKQMLRIEDGAANMLEDFLSRLAKKYKGAEDFGKIESILVKGLPTSRILEVSEKKNVAMIVMGSKGRTGIKHLVLGSVAERVVQMAKVPVTVTRAPKG